MMSTLLVRTLKIILKPLTSSRAEDIGLYEKLLTQGFRFDLSAASQD